MILFLRLLFLAAVTADKISPPYKSEGKCNNGISEFYNKEAQMCCSRCKPGTRLETPCTKDQDTVCLPCPNGQYFDKINHYGNCFTCTKCPDSKGMMYARVCSADTNAVCECKPGSSCGFVSQGICMECKQQKSCKPGEGVIQKGTPKANVQCQPCPEGTFSSRESKPEPCKPHTRCDGGLVLHPGNSTTDTQCGTKPSTTTSEMPKTNQMPPSEIKGEIQTTAGITSLPIFASVASNITESPTNLKPPLEQNFMPLIYTGIVVAVLVIFLSVTIMVITCKLQNRRGLAMDAKADKPEPNPPAGITPECQCLLPVDRCQKEPSMTSSDSQSQPDSSQSHSSEDWLERTSQEESLHEQPSISSPLVNFNININCQVNPATTSCSIPISQSVLAPQADISVPLSQEEVSISCQQKDDKDALQSVQESGLCAF